MTASNTFNASTTFVNCKESEFDQFIDKAREHFQNVEETLSFYAEHGTSLDSYEHDGKTRRDLLEEGFDRHETKEILDILSTFEEVGDFHNYGLCFDFVDADEETDGYYRFQICWGGPSSEIRFFEDGTIEAVYMDWFVGVGFNVTTWDSFNFVENFFKEVQSIDWDSLDYEQKHAPEYDEEEEEY